MDSLSPSERNPYAHMKRAKELEQLENVRAAEAEWKYAVRAADELPLAEYKRDMKSELVRYCDPAYQVKPGLSKEDLVRSYAEVLALPFIARVALASFYARHGAFEEAAEVASQAFAHKPDASALSDPRLVEMVRRAKAIRGNIHDMLGPEQLEILFKTNLRELDADGDGFVHHTELQQAQFSLDLSPECQQLIRHLLAHYFEIEASHKDEIFTDINGISLRDVQAYEKKRNASWKRMTKGPRQQPGSKHVL